MAVTPTAQEPQGASRVCGLDAVPWVLRNVQPCSPGDVYCSGWFGASGHGHDVVMARGNKLEVLMVTAQGTLLSVCCQPAFGTPVYLKPLPLASKPDVDTQAPLDLLLMLSDSGMLCILTFSTQLNRLVLLQQIPISESGQDVNLSGRLLAVAPRGQAVAVASCRDNLTIFSLAASGQQLQQQVAAFLHSVVQAPDQLATSGTQVCVLNPDSTLYSSAGSSFQLASSTLHLQGRLSMATSSEPAAGSSNLDQADMEQGEVNLGQATSEESPSVTTAGGSVASSELRVPDPFRDIITAALRKHPETEEGQEGEGFQIWDVTFLDVSGVTLKETSGTGGASQLAHPSHAGSAGGPSSSEGVQASGSIAQSRPTVPHLLTLTHRQGATCSHLTLLQWLPEVKTLRHMARLTLPHSSPLGLPVGLKAVPDGVAGVVVLGTASVLLLDCAQMLAADKAATEAADGEGSEGEATRPDALLALRALGPYPEMMSMALANHLTQGVQGSGPHPPQPPAPQTPPSHDAEPSLPRVRTSTASILLAKSAAGQTEVSEASRVPLAAPRGSHGLAHMAMCAAWLDLGQAVGPSLVHTLLVCTTTGAQFVIQVHSPCPGASVNEALPYQSLELLKHRSMLPHTALSYRYLPVVPPIKHPWPLEPVGHVVSLPDGLVVLREGAGGTFLSKVHVPGPVEGVVQPAWLPAVSFETCITPAAQWAAAYCSNELQKQLSETESDRGDAQGPEGGSLMHHVTLEGLCMVPEVVSFYPGLSVSEPTATAPSQIFAPVHSVVGGGTLPGCSTSGSTLGKLHSKVMVAQSSIPTQTLATWRAGTFPAVTGMWGVPSSFSDPLDAVLVISFLSATRVLLAGCEMHDITDVLGASSCESTVATGLVADGLIVQVTSSAVLLLSLEGVLPSASNLAADSAPDTDRTSPGPSQAQQQDVFKTVSQVNTTVASILGSIDLGLQSGTPCSARTARGHARGSSLAKISRTGPSTGDTWAGQGAAGGEAAARQAVGSDMKLDRAGSIARSQSWSGNLNQGDSGAPWYEQHARKAMEEDASMQAGLLIVGGGPQMPDLVQDIPTAERDLSIQSALRGLAVASSTEEGGDDATTGQSADMECDSRVTSGPTEADPRVPSQDHVDPPCVWRPEMCEGNTAGHVLTAAVAPGLVVLYQAGSHVVQVLRVTCVSNSQASAGVGPGWQGQVRKRRRPASQLAIADRIPWQHEVSCMQLELVDAPHTGSKGQARLPTTTSQQYFLLIGHHQPATSLLHLTVTHNAVHVAVLSQAVPPAFKTNYQLNESVEPESAYIPHSVLMQQGVTQHVDAHGQGGVQCDVGPSAQGSNGNGNGSKAVSASESARKAAAAVQVVVKWLAGFRQGTLGLYRWAGSTYPHPVGSTELLWVVQLGSTPLSLTSLLQKPYPPQPHSLQHSQHAASKQHPQLHGGSSTDITWSHVAVVGDATWVVHVVGPANRITWHHVHVSGGQMALMAPVRLSDEVVGEHRFPIVMSVHEDTSWQLMTIGIAKSGATSGNTRQEGVTVSSRNVGHTSWWWSHLQPTRVNMHGVLIGMATLDEDRCVQEADAEVMQVIVHSETRTVLQLCRASFDSATTTSEAPILHHLLKFSDKQTGNTLGMHTFPRSENPVVMAVWSKVGDGGVGGSGAANGSQKATEEEDVPVPRLALIGHSATLMVPVPPRVRSLRHFVAVGVDVSDPGQPHVVGAIKLLHFIRLKLFVKALEYPGCSSSEPSSPVEPGSMSDTAGVAAVCKEEAILKLPARVGALCVLPSGCLIAAVGNRLLCVDLKDNQLISVGSICARSYVTMLACCSEPNVFAASDGTSGVTLYVCNPAAQRPEPAIQVIASDTLARPVTSVSLVENEQLACLDSDVVLPALPSQHKPTTSPGVHTTPDAPTMRQGTPVQDEVMSPVSGAPDLNMAPPGTLDASRLMRNPAVTVVVSDNVGVITLLRPQQASLSPIRNLSQIGMLNLYDVGVEALHNLTGACLASQTQSRRVQGVGGAVGLLASIKGALSNGHFIHHTPLHEPKSLLSKGSKTMDTVSLTLACASGALYELRHVASNRAAMLLEILEGLMPGAHPALAPLSGCSHAAYRGTYTLDEMQHYTAPSARRVADGDLLEQFLDLPWPIRRHVVHRLLTTSKVACSLLQGLLPLVGTAAGDASSGACSSSARQDAGQQMVAGVEDAARLDAAVLFITSLVQQVLFGA